MPVNVRRAKLARRRMRPRSLLRNNASMSDLIGVCGFKSSQLSRQEKPNNDKSKFDEDLKQKLKWTTDAR